VAGAGLDGKAAVVQRLNEVRACGARGCSASRKSGGSGRERPDDRDEKDGT